MTHRLSLGLLLPLARCPSVVSFCRFSSTAITSRRPVANQSSPGNVCLLSVEDVDGVSRDVQYLDTLSAPVPTAATDSSKKEDRVVVILCGTAQSIPTWSLHTRHLAKTRRVLIPELRSQGRTTSLLMEHCTLAQHVHDLKLFLEHAQVGLDGTQKVDLVGFSLGGRIGLSFAEAYPDVVRSVSVTGVPHQRPYLGQLILRSWLSGLRNGEFDETVVSFFENGLSPKFYARNQRSMQRMINDVLSANESKRLMCLLENALVSGALGMSSDADPDAAVSVLKGRLRLRCHVQVIASEEDRLAGNGSELRLTEVIQEYHSVSRSRCRYDKILNCGHLAPFERPGEWRTLVENFLNDVEKELAEGMTEVD